MSNKRKALSPVFTTAQAEADLKNRRTLLMADIDKALEKYEFGINLALAYSKENIKPSIEFVNQKKYNIKDTNEDTATKGKASK